MVTAGDCFVWAVRVFSVKNKVASLNQLAGLWRDTWWVWLAFVGITVVMGLLVGWFFYLLMLCLPVPYVYFAFNRYDSLGNEKADL